MAANADAKESHAPPDASADPRLSLKLALTRELLALTGKGVAPVAAEAAPGSQTERLTAQIHSKRPKRLRGVTAAAVDDSSVDSQQPRQPQPPASGGAMRVRGTPMAVPPAGSVTDRTHYTRSDRFSHFSPSAASASVSATAPAASGSATALPGVAATLPTVPLFPRALASGFSNHAPNSASPAAPPRRRAHHPTSSMDGASSVRSLASTHAASDTSAGASADPNTLPPINMNPIINVASGGVQRTHPHAHAPTKPGAGAAGGAGDAYYSPRKLNHEFIKSSPLLRGWVYDYRTELGSFDQWIADCDKALDHALTVTDAKTATASGTASTARIKPNPRGATAPQLPSAYRTALCCDMLQKVCGTLSRFSSVVKALSGEMIASVYHGYSPDQRNSPQQRKLTPFFELACDLDAERGALDTRIADYRTRQRKLEAADKGKLLTLSIIGSRWSNRVLWHVFMRWCWNVRRIRAQRAALSHLSDKYNRYTWNHNKVVVSKLSRLFKHWQLYGRSLRFIKAKNLVDAKMLESEMCRAKYERLQTAYEHDAERLQRLTAESARVRAERNEWMRRLDAKTSQIRLTSSGLSVVQVTHTLLGVLWCGANALNTEFVMLRRQKPQDPTRLFNPADDADPTASGTSSTSGATGLLYSYDTDLSSGWAAHRAAEVERCEKSLDDMTDQDVLMCWFNYHLSAAEKAYKRIPRAKRRKVPGITRRLENFNYSLQDSELYLRVLSRVAPFLWVKTPAGAHLYDVNLSVHIDLHTRAKKLVALFKLLNAELGPILQPSFIAHALHPDVHAAFISRLMLDHTQLPYGGEWFDPEHESNVNAVHHSATHTSGGGGGMAGAPSPLITSHSMYASEKRAIDDALGSLAREIHDIMNEKQNEELKAKAAAAEAAGTAPAAAAATAGADAASAAGTSMPAAPPLFQAQSSTQNPQSGGGDEQYGPVYRLMDQLYRLKTNLDSRAAAPPPPPPTPGGGPASTPVASSVPPMNGSGTGLLALDELEALHSSVQNTLRSARAVLDDAYDRQRLWRKVRQRVRTFFVEILTARTRGTPLTMLDPKAQRDIVLFTRLTTEDFRPIPSLRDLVDPSIAHAASESQLVQELDQIKSLVVTHYSELRQIFRNYAATDTKSSDMSVAQTATMNFFEFYTLLKESNLLGGGAKPPQTGPTGTDPAAAASAASAAAAANAYKISIEKIFARTVANSRLNRLEEFEKLKKMKASAELAAAAAIGRASAAVSTATAASSGSLAAAAAAAATRAILGFGLGGSTNPSVAAAVAAASSGWNEDDHRDMLSLEESLKRENEIDLGGFIEILIRVAHSRVPPPKERQKIIDQLNAINKHRMPTTAVPSSPASATGNTSRPVLKESNSGSIARDATAAPPSTTQPASAASLARSASASAVPTAGDLKSAPSASASGVGASDTDDTASTASSGHASSSAASNVPSALVPGTDKLTLYAKLYGLLKFKILVYAVRLDSDQFRDQLRRQSVIEVFQKSKKHLIRVFRAYGALNRRSKAGIASGDDAAGEESGTIDCPEFLTLLRDAKLLDSRLTTAHVYQIFAAIQNELFIAPPKKIDSRALANFRTKAKVQRSATERNLFAKTGDADSAADEKAEFLSQLAATGTGTGAGAGGAGAAAASASAGGDGDDAAHKPYPDAELVYSEFCEMLAAIAAFRYPNPYQSMDEKLRSFLDDELIPWIKKQKDWD